MRNTILSLAIVGLVLGGFSTHTPKAQDKINFEKEIWPFVKASCAKCHLPSYKDERGRTKKPKAGLVVTNKEALMEGGEEGEVIVAGEPKKSEFLNRTLLPDGSDDQMPPEGKAEPWTKEQKELFAKWIEQGADFGDWTADKEVEDDPGAAYEKLK